MHLRSKTSFLTSQKRNGLGLQSEIYGPINVTDDDFFAITGILRDGAVMWNIR